MVVGRNFLKEQAALLLAFAKTVSDPKVSPALIEKAAEIAERRGQTTETPDVSPKPPDVEFP